MYVKPENDTYFNRNITNTAQLLTWKPGIIDTILAARLSSRFRTKCIELKSRACDKIISAINGQKKTTIVPIARAI